MPAADRKAGGVEALGHHRLQLLAVPVEQPGGFLHGLAALAIALRGLLGDPHAFGHHGDAVGIAVRHLEQVLGGDLAMGDGRTGLVHHRAQILARRHHGLGQCMAEAHAGHRAQSGQETPFVQLHVCLPLPSLGHVLVAASMTQSAAAPKQKRPPGNRRALFLLAVRRFAYAPGARRSKWSAGPFRSPLANRSSQFGSAKATTWSDRRGVRMPLPPTMNTTYCLPL